MDQATFEAKKQETVNKVFYPEFFRKLAAHGKWPADETEARNLIYIGEVLLSDHLVKSAQAATAEQTKQSGLIEKAASELHNQATRAGWKIAPPPSRGPAALDVPDTYFQDVGLLKNAADLAELLVAG